MKYDERSTRERLKDLEAENQRLGQKVICEQCGWQGTAVQLALANDPFRPQRTLVACPSCFELTHSCRIACDEPGCFEIATCGTSTSDGYRRTCYAHTRSPV